ncbi:hypothetical protein ABW22_11770 [Thiobacillus denitrificans]|uniref:Uncharacterized protein n=1 Tax=Thiobacillus denitrificans TaxID=36861 RepID=A0A106BLQ0_THIDE|nr:hypothetical protein ABW22_11770 [Thiobacillus denitrificans]
MHKAGILLPPQFQGRPFVQHPDGLIRQDLDGTLDCTCPLRIAKMPDKHNPVARSAPHRRTVHRAGHGGVTTRHRHGCVFGHGQAGAGRPHQNHAGAGFERGRDMARHAHGVDQQLHFATRRVDMHAIDES